MAIPDILGKIIGAGTGSLVKDIGDTASKFITTDKDRLQFEQDLNKLLSQNADKQSDLIKAVVGSQEKTIVAEEQGESWLQRNWRPMLMVLFGLIILNNFILVPYLTGLLHVVSLPIPVQLWDLIEISIGGYVGGRSLEKISKSIAPALTGKSLPKD